MTARTPSATTSDDSPPTPDADSVAAMVDEATHEVIDQEVSRLDELRERVEALIVSRPLPAIGAAFGVGFVLARLLRR